jgi:hypothetical protein
MSSSSSNSVPDPVPSESVSMPLVEPDDLIRSISATLPFLSTSPSSTKKPKFVADSKTVVSFIGHMSEIPFSDWYSSQKQGDKAGSSVALLNQLVRRDDAFSQMSLQNLINWGKLLTDSLTPTARGIIDAMVGEHFEGFKRPTPDEILGEPGTNLPSQLATLREKIGISGILKLFKCSDSNISLFLRLDQDAYNDMCTEVFRCVQAITWRCYFDTRAPTAAEETQARKTANALVTDQKRQAEGATLSFLSAVDKSGPGFERHGLEELPPNAEDEDRVRYERAQASKPASREPLQLLSGTVLNKTKSSKVSANHKGAAEASTTFEVSKKSDPKKRSSNSLYEDAGADSSIVDVFNVFTNMQAMRDEAKRQRTVDSMKASEKAELRKLLASPQEDVRAYAFAALKTMQDEEDKEKKQKEDACDA